MKATYLTEFTDFGLAAPILRALATEGYVTPTPIQSQAIPSIIGGRDVVGIAQTGTGKVGSSRVDLQACKLEYSIVSPK